MSVWSCYDKHMHFQSISWCLNTCHMKSSRETVDLRRKSNSNAICYLVLSRLSYNLLAYQSDIMCLVFVSGFFFFVFSKITSHLSFQESKGCVIWCPKIRNLKDDDVKDDLCVRSYLLCFFSAKACLVVCLFVLVVTMNRYTKNNDVVSLHFLRQDRYTG